MENIVGLLFTLIAIKLINTYNEDNFHFDFLIGFQLEFEDELIQNTELFFIFIHFCKIVVQEMRNIRKQVF